MNENAAYYNDLITRYFSGELNGEELRLLSDWLKKDAANEEEFRHIHKIWLLLEKHRLNSKMDVNHEWDALQSLINKTEVQPAPKVIPFAQQNTHKRISLFKSWKVAAAVVVILASSFLLYTYFSRTKLVEVVAQDRTIQQTLPDGSVVSLHAGSKLWYPEKFGAGKREVNLKGEAYFVVTHNLLKPFVVTTGNANVEVLGTEFNVNTHSQAGNMEVILTKGKVSVYYTASPDRNVVLMPGEKAECITSNGTIRKTVNSDPNYMAWKTGALVFDDATLAEVINTLQNVYQTHIALANPQLAGCRITVSFNGQSLDSVLEVLKTTLDLTVTQSGNSITLEGNACR